MSVTPSERLVELAWALGLGSTVLAAAMAAAALLLRQRAVRAGRRVQARRLAWRRMLVGAGDPCDPLPALAARELPGFAHDWLRLQESMRGDARRRLDRLARRVGLDRTACEWLQAGAQHRRLLAVCVLGLLGERAVMPELLRLLGHRSPALSLAAAQAQVRIDARATLAPVLGRAADRRDWAIARLLAVLREAPPAAMGEALAAVLTRRLHRAQPRAVARLLRLGPLAEPAALADVLGTVLEHVDEPRARVAGLALLRRPQQAHLARAAVDDADPRVRRAARAALDRVASR